MILYKIIKDNMNEEENNNKLTDNIADKYIDGYIKPHLKKRRKNSRIKRCIINPVRKSLWQTGVGRISTGWFIVFTIG